MTKEVLAWLIKNSVLIAGVLSIISFALAVENRVTALEARYDSIIRYLDRIERKVDVVYGHYHPRD